MQLQVKAVGINWTMKLTQTKDLMNLAGFLKEGRFLFWKSLVQRPWPGWRQSQQARLPTVWKNCSEGCGLGTARGLNYLRVLSF